MRITDFKRLRTPDLEDISNDVKYAIGRKTKKNKNDYNLSCIRLSKRFIGKKNIMRVIFR